MDEPERSICQDFGDRPIEPPRDRERGPPLFRGIRDPRSDAEAAHRPASQCALLRIDGLGLFDLSQDLHRPFAIL